MANINQMRYKIQFAAWILLLSLGANSTSFAATTDLASSPLSSTSTSVVFPNILFTLDDSGSMGWAYLPDYAGGGTYGSSTAYHCKVSNTCGAGETPFSANEYNGMAYNPRTTYKLPVNYDGTFKASQGSPWTAVKVDGYGVQSASTINLVSGYPEKLYGCSSGCPSGWTNKKNGVDTNNPFSLRATIAADNAPLYAFPSTLSIGASVSGNVFNGTLNQAVTTVSTLYDGNGTLNRPTAGTTTNYTLTGRSLTHSGDTVTVVYSGSSPTAPAFVNGDTVTVSRPSGGLCSKSWRESSVTMSNVAAGSFTYVGNSNTDNSWTNNVDCRVVVSHTVVPSVTPPSISKSGDIVTVTLASAPSPALANGNLVTIANGSGTCGSAYKATNTPMTRISSTSFSYNVVGGTGSSSTSCNLSMSSTSAVSTPWVSYSGSVVTVHTPHNLSTGDLITVSNATAPAGTCDSGFQTSGSVAVTRVDANTFSYTSMGGATTNSQCNIDKMLAGTGTAVAYTSGTTVNANPYYFTIIPTEYCDSIYLTNCKVAVAPLTVSGVDYKYPAPVRFCKDDATAALPPGNAGAQTSASGTINCQAKYSVGTGMNFQSVRYGLLYREDIVPATAYYGNVYFSGVADASGVTMTYSNALVVDRSGRSDCAAAPVCTYAEEMTNFANWYAYYRTRMQMMKSAAGYAFSALDDRYRVGFVTINENAGEFLPVARFTSGTTGQKYNWYTNFYAVVPGNSTPLRRALSNAGRYFAGKQPGILTGDPMEYACQQNFEILTTDGYWNGTDSDSKEIDGSTTMRNYDNADSGLSTRGIGAYDGGVSGASNTLADAALYYYKTDLRTGTFGSTVAGTLNNCAGALGTDVCKNIVPTSPTDTQATQHMNTFSLGLADGLMTYQDNYQTAVTGDFSKIKTAAIGCSFSGSGTCNWPLPVADSQTALDDLWHAAVNGRGAYYNARDPESLSRGLTAALSGIKIHTAAAAASATSSPNITQTDRSIFSSTYRTSVWDGEVIAQLIDPATGNVEPSILWSAQQKLDILVHSTSDTTIPSRQILTFDGSNATGDNLKPFQYVNLSASEQAYFDNRCISTLLTQCTPTLTASETASGNSGLNMVNYLRGDQLYEGAIYRARAHFLGDTVNAKPSYVRLPQYSFTDTATDIGYSAFKTANATRQGALYMGSNDGMLHAFNSDTGDEMWAYVPKMVMPNLYKLADSNYSTNHSYYVDGSPETMDIYVATATGNLTVGWHTILVGGLGLGGRGYYALDITNPAHPRALWEICSDNTLCAVSDIDIGNSYGNPVIVKRSTDQKWVVLVTSGYNNVTPGSGAGTLIMLDALTGAVLHKTSTGAATNPPSGLAKLSPWIDDLSTSYITRFVYGGDLNGDVWRFDLGPAGADITPTVTKIASLKDASGVAQSITTRLELGDPFNNITNSLGGTGIPALFVGTGRYLGTSDLTNVQIQSLYGIKDDLSRTCPSAGCYASPRAYNIAASDKFVHQYIYETSPTTRSTSTNAVSWASNSGWYADFMVSDSITQLPVSPSPSPGERVNLDPQLVSGTLIVVTNVPETSACTIGGSSWLYSFDFLTGQYVASASGQIVGQKLGNALAVGFVTGRLPGGQIKAWVTTADGSKLPEDPITKGSGATRKTSWRELTTQ